MNVGDRLSRVGTALGMGDRRATSWALYDWANSAFATTVLAAVFPIYYESVTGAALTDPEGALGAVVSTFGIENATVAYSYTTTVALLSIAVMAPVLGALADYYRMKKPTMAGFVLLGVVSTAGLFFVDDVLALSGLFVLANVGFAGANVFYDSLLPHVTDDTDRLSAAGYALGYFGGGLLLVVNLAWILVPTTFGFASETVATRYALLSVAVWWAVFSVPVFRAVPEPRPETTPERFDGGPVRVGVTRLWTTLRSVGEYRDLLVYLLAFLLYADGIGTIIRMATIYGRSVGIGQTDLVGALVLVQFAGVPFAFAFGRLAGRVGQKNALYLGLSVYTAISVLGFFMSEGWHFWALAVGVATVQGGTQAVSRSLYADLVPNERSAEFFSFFSVSSKFAGVLGPFVFGVVTQVTGTSRVGIVALVVFFVGGMALLGQVDVETGRRVARGTDTDGHTPGTSD